LARFSRKNKEHKRLVSMINPHSLVSEQYKVIRTNIQFSSFDKELKTIVVTSSKPGEGKSTTAANLAITFVQQGMKVLLIDGDLRKPTSHHTFSVPNTKGLTSVLTRQCSFKEAVKQYSQEKLDILTSGPIPPNPAEILASNSMKELLEEASEHYDLILLDTPPLLAVADPQILANVADGVVLVLSSGDTEKDAALKSKEILVNANARILGVVLNNLDSKNSKHQYYYSDN
jgi:capsular exopolysaccharide synthesis family protein